MAHIEGRINMREKTVTRTFIITSVEVSLYNKDTKGIEKSILKAIDIVTSDIGKWLKKQFERCNVVVLDYEIMGRHECKYSMSLEDFIKYGEEV